jgi:hypothetical protein
MQVAVPEQRLEREVLVAARLWDSSAVTALPPEDCGGGRYHSRESRDPRRLGGRAASQARPPRACFRPAHGDAAGASNQSKKV